MKISALKISAFRLMPHRELSADFEQRYESVWVTRPQWELADVGQHYPSAASGAASAQATEVTRKRRPPAPSTDGTVTLSYSRS
jgi:hypothetical protein